MATKKSKPTWSANQASALSAVVAAVAWRVLGRDASKDERADLEQSAIEVLLRECDPSDRAAWERRALRVVDNLRKNAMRQRQRHAKQQHHLERPLGELFESKTKERVPNGYKRINGHLVPKHVRVTDASGRELSPGGARLELGPTRRLTKDELNARDYMNFVFGTHMKHDPGVVEFDVRTIDQMRRAFAAAFGFPMTDLRWWMAFKQLRGFAESFHRAPADEQDRLIELIEADDLSLFSLPKWFTGEMARVLVNATQLGRGGGRPTGERKKRSASAVALTLVNAQRKREKLPPLKNSSR